MKLHVKCDTWYIQEYFIHFANDNEISQSAEHYFESKARDREPWEQESLCWGSVRLLCPGLAPGQRADGRWDKDPSAVS